MDALPEPSVASRVYISGPMTGLPEHNFPAFNAEAARLRAMGYEVANPAENPLCDSWQQYMRQDIAQLVGCDWMLMLPGWQRSKGAGIEHRLALDLGLPVFYAAGAEDG
jgi:hypothetical protein